MSRPVTFKYFWNCTKSVLQVRKGGLDGLLGENDARREDVSGHNSAVGTEKSAGNGDFKRRLTEVLERRHQ